MVDPCRECNGKGKIRMDRKITLKIPPGVDTGSQLRLQGEGEAGENGGPPGDLFVVIHVKDHDFFKREGEHLLCEIPVSFVQAALGNTITIPVLGNEGGEELHIPSGTQPGDILTLPGLGMPSLQRNKRGDLYIKVSVKIPKKLTSRQKELLEEFAKERRHQGIQGEQKILAKNHKVRSEVDGSVMMSKQKLEYYRNLMDRTMAELLDEANKTVSDMTTHNGNLPDPTDRATLESDRNFTLRIRDRERKLIGKIKEALERIDYRHLRHLRVLRRRDLRGAA